MLNKMAIAIFLSLVMGLALSLSVAAADNNFVGETVVCDRDCVDAQFERLTELLAGNFVVPFSADGEPVNVPRVNFIIPPEGGRSYFLIGLEDIPTQECIDFVLLYTGISRERAYIERAILTRRVRWGYRDSHDNEAAIRPCESVGYLQEIAPASTLSIGSLIQIDLPNGRYGETTLGHPLNAQADRFATAPHTITAQNSNVFTFPFIRHIGVVSQAWFEPRRDVAIVDLIGHRVHPFVDGGQINNFRATAGIDNPVVSARGVSGLQRDMHVYSITARSRFPGESFDFLDKIATYPVRRIADGDSGAALIRRLAPTDRAVLGTLAGDVRLGGRLVAIYTKVTNYP